MQDPEKFSGSFSLCLVATARQDMHPHVNTAETNAAEISLVMAWDKLGHYI